MDGPVERHKALAGSTHNLRVTVEAQLAREREQRERDRQLLNAITESLGQERRTTTMIEAPYEMANLFPKHTGLPFVVWISVRGGARHDARVKVSANAKAMPGEMATVGIRPIEVIEGKMDAHALRQLRAWIELNQATLVAYWESEIDTQDALNMLVKLEER